MNKTIKIIIIVLVLFLELITAGCGTKTIVEQAESGDIEAVKAALAKDPTLINRRLGQPNFTLLQAAAQGGQIEMLEFLLSQGADLYHISGKKYPGPSALGFAAQHGHLDTVKFLLEKDTDPAHQKDRSYRLYKAAYMASYTGHTHIVKFLIQQGADMSIREKKLGSPLESAVYQNNRELVKLLLDNNAVMEREKKSRFGILHSALYRGDKEILLMLMEKGAEIDKQNYRGQTPLHFAAAYRDSEIVRLFLEKGAKVNILTREKDTPLHYAISRRRAGNVLALLEYGAQVHIKDAIGRTPMMLAVDRASPSVKDVLLMMHHQAAKEDARAMERMIEKFPQLINSRDEAGKTPLHYAALNNRLENARLLIAAGADIHALTKLRRTDLIHGIVARVLVPGDGRIKWKKDKKTPLQLALQYNHKEMAQLLENAAGK